MHRRAERSLSCVALPYGARSNVNEAEVVTTFFSPSSLIFRFPFLNFYFPAQKETLRLIRHFEYADPQVHADST